MTAAETWEETNGAYLAAGLAWLRQRLAGDVPDAPVWWEDARFARSESIPALELVGDRFGLSRFERLVLLLVASIEIDPGLGALIAAANGAPYPTFALALAVLPDPAWEVVSPHRPLRHWRLIELPEREREPLTTTGLRADERILSFIKGLNAPDDRLGHLVKPVGDLLDEPLPGTQEDMVLEIVRALSAATAIGQPPVVELVGVDPLVRRGLAVAAAHRIGHGLFELTPERIPQSPSDLDDLTRLWERETILAPVLLYVDVAHLRAGDASGLEAALAAFDTQLLLGCREPWPLRGRHLRVVDVARPSAAEQEFLWAGSLAGTPDVWARLASEFDLNQVVIADVAGQVGSAGADRLWAACRAQARPRLDTLAHRVEPVAAWDDLVLPAEELRLLHHLVDQVRGRSTVLRSWGLAERIRRGSAVTALFAGPSGTGKTLAAEVIAHELELDLYRIDLAGVVSKYIGETEQNLRRVFDAADEGGALLLFDEADALFGKRSEVKDSHDRYANIEVSYLLQRIEDFQGVAILTSNMRHALDDAFLRRLRFVVPFPFPAPPERALLWERAFPDRAPVAALDLPRLARLAASGGMIRNIALNAAFCAAGRQCPLSMELVLELARVEFRKLELPINDADFRLDEVPA